jgi:hypothetical protein
VATETLSFDILARDLASSSFKNMGRAALDAAGSMKELSSRLDKVSGRVAEARVGLQGDKQAQVELDKIGVKLINLGRRTANPNIDLKGALGASAQIGAIDLALDRLDGRRVTVSVGIRQRLGEGVLGGLSPGGAGGGGLGLLGPAAIGGGIVGAGLVPGAVGLGIGGLAGAGLVGGGLFGAAQGKKQLTTDLSNISQITTKLKTAIGQQRTALSADLKRANQQYAKDSAFYAPFTALSGAIKSLTQTFLAPLRPVMAPLVGIFKEFGKGLTGLGPQFTALFKASLPFIKQFLGFMLQAGKILLPAFTQAMNQMVKSGALQAMVQALVVLTKGLATFIVNLGPGMAASAQIFARLATFIARTLGFLGDAFTVIAKVLAFNFPAAAHKGVSIVEAGFKSFGIFMGGLLRELEKVITGAWSTIWQNTVNLVRSGVGTTVGIFRSLPGRAIGALRGLGHGLAAFASSAFNEMWNAIRNVAGNIWHWLTGWVSRLPGFLKHLLGIHSPSSVFYDIGKQMMMGLFHGIQDHAHHAANAARSSVSGFADTGARSGNAALAQSFAASILPRGWSFPALLSLWNQESGWNAYAVNPSSGAYGIPQSLGHGHPYNLGDYKAQIAWGLNYIAGRYGNSQAAWAHEQAFNWYGSGFHGWFDKPTLIGVGERGRERVDISPARPERGSGSGHVVLEIRSGGSRLDDAIVEIIRQAVKVRGGGNVQIALGRRGA